MHEDLEYSECNCLLPAGSTRFVGSQWQQRRDLAMKTISALSALLLLTLWTNTFACGDKFLVAGRGIRYERAHAAVQPGSILMYRNRNFEDPKAGNDLENALKKVGHKVQSVDDVTKLDATLKTGKFDLVVVNLSDAPLLEKQIVN